MMVTLGKLKDLVADEMTVFDVVVNVTSAAGQQTPGGAATFGYSCQWG
jgi:hypothetical protein